MPTNWCFFNRNINGNKDENFWSMIIKSCVTLGEFHFSQSSDSGSSSSPSNESEEQQITDAHETFTGFWFTSVLHTASLSNAYLHLNFFVE